MWLDRMRTHDSDSLLGAGSEELEQNGNLKEVDWVPDNRANECKACLSVFGMFFRRHHCRICGQVYCKNCSNERTVFIDNVQKKLRMCDKCNEMQKFQNENKQRQDLIRGHIDEEAPSELYKESIDTSRSYKNNQMHSNSQRQIAAEQFEPGNLKLLVSDMEKPPNEDFFELPKTPSKKQQVSDMTLTLSRRSTIHQNKVKQLLLNTTGERSDPWKANNAAVRMKSTNLDLKKDGPVNFQKDQYRGMQNWIQDNMHKHIERIVQTVVLQHHVNQSTWQELLMNYTQKAVQTIKPSSRLLGDSLDFSSFIKIVTIQGKDSSQSRYVNGVVFKKDVAHKSMATDIEEPKILMLANSLGYLQDEADYMDIMELQQQEDPYFQIIRSKVNLVKPNIIFVEKNASRKAIESFKEDGITLVTDVPSHMMAMITRCTQTVMCPSTNLISASFIVGRCKHFYTQKVAKIQDKNISEFRARQSLYDQSRAQSTALMCLEGTHAKLGCSIVLSGPNKAELKQVKKALKECLKLARTVILEREYLMFVHPNRYTVASSSKELHVPTSGSMRSGLNESDSDSLLENEESNSPKSPFLIDKHLQRDSITFEYITMVEPVMKSKSNRERNQDDSVSDLRFNMSNMEGSNNDESVLYESATQIFEMKDESEMRKNYRLMCHKPERQIVKFYSEVKQSQEDDTEHSAEQTTISDISIIDWLKGMQRTARQPCRNEDCKRQKMLHTDYYYHGQGCIQIRVSPSINSDVTQDDPKGEPRVFVYCECSRCAQMVIQRQEMPSEVLEMSFYKLLEQFFYNQELVSQKTTEFFCDHSFHKDALMVIRYGQIKICLKYEASDCYSLDLIHFAKEEGVMSKADVQSEIIANLDKLKGNLSRGIDWIVQWLSILTTFVDKAMMVENIENTNKQQLSCDMLLLIEVFKEQVLQIKVEGGKELSALKLDTQMQMNRVKHLVSERVSEIVYLLKGFIILVQSELVPEYVADKNSERNFVPGSIIPTMRTSFASQKISRQRSSQSVFSSNVDEIQIEDLAAEIDSFEKILAQQTVIKDLVETCANIPLGFNQNCVQLNPNDIGSLIAASLNSNLYHSGLASIDYMNMQSNLYPYQSKSRKAQALMNQENQKMELDPENDVLNGEVKVQQIEQVLIADNSYMFCFHFTTQRSPQLVIALAKDFEQDQNMIHEGLTIKANQKREYYSRLTTNAAGERVTKEGDIVAETKWLSQAQPQVEELYESFNMLLMRNKQWKQSSKKEKKLSKELMSNSMVFSEQDEGEMGWADVRNTYGTSLEKGDFFSLKNRGESVPCVSESMDIKVSRQNSKPIRLTTVDGWANMSQTNKLNEMPQDLLKREEQLLLSDAKTEIYDYFHDRLDMLVRVYFPGKFEALRKLYCGDYDQVLKSIAHSKVWAENTGGKSNSTFFKTADEKYVFKTVNAQEIRMFGNISDSYFEYLSRSFMNQCPTAIAKILGVFELTVKTYPCKTPFVDSADVKVDKSLEKSLKRQLGDHGLLSSKDNIQIESEVGPRQKTKQHIYVLMMENLLLGVDDTASVVKYDLKGSRRNRYITGRKDGKVTLDNNFIFDMKSRPLPMQYQMKRMMQIAINNDSLYLAKHSIIDYSLFVAIDRDKKTVRVGLIDYVQHYTFKKVLESKVKQATSEIEPTIISPDAYKKRFRTAMDKYFIALVPDKNTDLQSIVEKILKRQFDQSVPFLQ